MSEILSGDIRKSLLMSLQTEEARYTLVRGGKKQIDMRLRERERERDKE